jgi:hypothetical protein
MGNPLQDKGRFAMSLTRLKFPILKLFATA